MPDRNAASEILDSLEKPCGRDQSAEYIRASLCIKV